jgi:hypothetical protein
MSLVIDDGRYRAGELSIPELQSEVQSLLERDIENPQGQAHVVAAILRRYPDTPQNVAVQIAILEGEVIRRQVMLDLIGWVFLGQTFFGLLGKFASTNRGLSSTHTVPIPGTTEIGPDIFPGR